MRRMFSLVVLVCCVALLGACGSDDDGGSGEKSVSTGKIVEGKQGGKLTVLFTDDTDFIDCGSSYYSVGWMICGATQRALFGFKPDDAENNVPDLATGPAEISEDGKTVTVKIQSGIKFSPPVDREVTSKDVKYAIERGFFNTVNNGYAGAYLGDVEGAKVGVKPGTKISGITTPDDQTIVFTLKRPTGGVVAGTLALPLSAPVPEEYAAKFDKKNPSTYGANQVATGPYMIENNAAGKAIGYEPGKRIHLVRNPNWDKSTDFKPAYVDEIDMPQGNDDTTVATRKILTGQSLVTGDFSPPPAEIKKALTANKDQLAIVSAGGERYVAMNTKVKPFDDINVRKAVVAGFDREALLLVRGGKIVGDIPTHYIPPGVPGHEESGGMEGPGFDFMSKTGKPNPALAAEYFKKAGFASGKYEGSEQILMVGTSEGVAEKIATVAKENFEKLGFKVRLRLVTQDSMYTKFCNVPKAKVAVCPNVGWFKDFSDAQTMLGPTFKGANILPQGNSNWPQLDVPEIDKAMDAAEQLTDPGERAQAFAEINKMITEQAPAVIYQWEKEVIVASKNVNLAASEFFSQPDLTFTSLK